MVFKPYEVDDHLIKSILYKKGGRELFLLHFVWLENSSLALVFLRLNFFVVRAVADFVGRKCPFLEIP